MINEHIEEHPLAPFLPSNAKVLMLGSFPPPKLRWKMDFYYPNFQNDMWRIMGLIFFNDKDHFIDVKNKLFYEKEIIAFLEKQGIAIYDAAEKIKRLQNNASDKYLEIIQTTDLHQIFIKLQSCTHIITTGDKATQLVLKYYKKSDVKVSIATPIELKLDDNNLITLYRLPSSSRAYPLPLSQKAEIYQRCFLEIFGGY